MSNLLQHLRPEATLLVLVFRSCQNIHAARNRSASIYIICRLRVLLALRPVDRDRKNEEGVVINDYGWRHALDNDGKV